MGLHAYRHRIDEEHSPACPSCPGEDHNLLHWLMKCSATAELRQRLFGTDDVTQKNFVIHPKEIVEMARKTLSC